jgi:lipopolysaccharide transport system permease protein
MNKQPIIHIKPKKGLQYIDFRELARYWDLFNLLWRREIKIKYKQTVLGGLWAVIQPLFLMVVFSLLFGRLAKIPSDGIPYPIFNYTALVAWTYFSTSINTSSNSIVGSGSLISKVYFPRIFIPLTPVMAGLLDFFLAFLVLLGMMICYHIYPSVKILALFWPIILMIFTASGVGMILSALSAKYRDIKYTVPLLIQFWMFATPIVYPVSMIPQKYRMIYSLNPMTGVIEGFRSALLGTVAFPTAMLLISTVISLALFVIGLTYFKQVERYFADVI